jgi:uncharacterized protein (DUF58 family)
MAIKEIKLDLTPKIKKLEVYTKKNILNKMLEGNWSSAFRGRGMEFAGFRSYNYNDDASQIDWKATLRAKETLVREYEIERSVNTFFLFDVSNSMLFSSTGKLKCEYAAELIDTMIYAILEAGDNVGMGMFTDKFIVKIEPNMGHGMYYKITQELLNPENYGGNFDFEAICKLTSTFLTTNAMLIIISDFLGLNDNWYKYLNMLSQNYEVIGIMVRDPRDSELPEDIGQYILEDPYSREKMKVDMNKYRALYREYVKKEEFEIEKRFKATKSDFLKIKTDEDFYDPLLKFFRKRQYVQQNM